MNKITEKEVICNRCCVYISVRRMFLSNNLFPKFVCPQCGNHDKIEFVGERKL